MTIKDEWESYAKDVIPPNCHPIQLRETKRAFYAGAVAFMHIIINADLEAEVNPFNTLQDELLAFRDSVGKEN